MTREPRPSNLTACKIFLLIIFKLWNLLLYTVSQEQDVQLVRENEAQETPRANVAEGNVQSK